MRTPKTNPSAFPLDVEHIGYEWGMSLRDYFAAKAMQASFEEVSRYDQFDSCAKDAYKMADAMMTARNSILLNHKEQ